MKFLIFGNASSKCCRQTVSSVTDILQSNGQTVITESDFKESCRPDAIISVGGDGTFLRTAARVGSLGIPMLGVNAGRLGFLADIPVHHIEETLKDIISGHYSVRQRTLLQLQTESGSDKACSIPADCTPYALNEIAILKHDISSMISIDTYVDGTHLTTYMADGLVIATPTGSTAYSLSVGGPVIAPDTDVIALTPVAPHSLTMRPLIIAGHNRIDLKVESRARNFLVSVDGRSFSCPEDVQLHITQAPFKLNVIRPDHSNFFSTLREKMMWGADSRV